MNLNKNFLTEVIKYLINRGVTLADVMDTFNEHFNTSDNAIKNEHENHNEVRKPITNIDLMLCGKSVEESSTPCTTVDSNRDLCRKVEKKAEKPAPLKVSLSPNVRDYPTSVIPRGKGVSKARKMLFEVVEGKTVLEHLKANNINYKLFDTRIRKNWTMEKACMTPMTRVISPYTKSKKPVEKAAPMIVPDTIICLEPEKITGTKVKVVEETSPKTKMMLVNGRMTEIKVSDTDLVQSSIIEKPVETLETKTETLETESNTEKATESVTNATELNGNNVTAVILDTPNPDAIRKDKDDMIEKALKKFVTHTEESKKDKKPKETKSDLTVLEVCQKMNITTHELKEMINSGEFPQSDCGNKWSTKLLKKEGII